MNTISSLEPTGLPTASRVEKRVHAFPWSEETFASNQGDHYLNSQLKIDNVVVVFAITRVVPDEATLLNIAVDPDFRCRGLGHELLEHLIGKPEKRGTLALQFEMHASNVAVIVLYEGLDFNEATIRHNHYPTADGHESVIIMALSTSTQDRV